MPETLMPGKTKGFRFFLVLMLLLPFGCRNKTDKVTKPPEASGNKIEHAERFSIEVKNGYTEVKIINPWQGAANISQTFYLVQRGSVVPAGLDSASVIFVPLRKIVCMSTTHIGMISALGEENSISGVSGQDFIYSPAVKRNIEKGLVSDVGYEANLNKELVLKLSPDLIMIYGIGSESAGYVGKIKELGIKVLINADYLETDPLSRAEWVKLFGALYDRESMADSIFNLEVNQYNTLKSLILGRITDKPKVLLGMPFKDTWYISPGNSFISRLISDAGGDYIWSDLSSSVSMPYGIENVFLKALKADYWLNISTVNSKSDISYVDQRLTELPCFKKGNLYNNNRRITEGGGNDFWESGSIYPHLLLKDIASILHPGLFSDHELVFYKKIN
jgi:iron complex transport system substrate-binding protein